MSKDEEDKGNMDEGDRIKEKKQKNRRLKKEKRVINIEKKKSSCVTKYKQYVVCKSVDLIPHHFHSLLD